MYTVRASAEFRTIPNAKKPGQSHGFQKCGLIDSEGFMDKFEMYFDPSKASFALEPGEYLVKGFRPSVNDGRLVLYPEFERVTQAKQAAKAA
jgi:hypothetical protein